MDHLDPLNDGFSRTDLGLVSGSSHEQLTVVLPDDIFEEGVDAFRHSLIGRLDLQKLKFADAAIALRHQWKLKGACKIIPLGRGFFTIQLDNDTDRTYVRSGSWEVHNQFLRVRNWVYNFRPEKQRSSKAAVWVRFPGLGLEFWKEKILFTICREFGNPLKVDNATLKCDVGFYANVLVELDFAKRIPSSICIDTKLGKFDQEVLIPDCPKFCNNCEVVGHWAAECRSAKKNKDLQEAYRFESGNNKQFSKEKVQVIGLQVKDRKKHIPEKPGCEGWVAKDAIGASSRVGGEESLEGKQFGEKGGDEAGLFGGLNAQETVNVGWKVKLGKSRAKEVLCAGNADESQARSHLGRGKAVSTDISAGLKTYNRFEMHSLEEGEILSPQYLEKVIKQNGDSSKNREDNSKSVLEASVQGKNSLSSGKDLASNQGGDKVIAVSLLDGASSTSSDPTIPPGFEPVSRAQGIEEVGKEEEEVASSSAINVAAEGKKQQKKPKSYADLLMGSKKDLSFKSKATGLFPTGSLSLKKKKGKKKINDEMEISTTKLREFGDFFGIDFPTSNIDCQQMISQLQKNHQGLIIEDGGGISK